MRLSYAVATCSLAAALAAGCDATGPTNGAIRITVATSGVDLDADGYGVLVDNGSPQPVAPNGTLVITGLPTGTRILRLQQIALNCSRTDNFATRAVTVVAGDTADIAFNVNCSADVGTVRVFVTTTGADLDPDGYTLSVDGAPGQAVTGTPVSIEGLRTGVHTLTLSGLAENCQLLGSSTVNVIVAFGGTIGTEYIVSCSPIPGRVRVITTTTGVNLDPNGYGVLVDDAEVQSPVSVNGEVIMDGLTPGNRSVKLLGLAPNCTVSGSNPRVVFVVAKATSDAAFSVTCAPHASAQLRAVTTGADLDPNGYVVNVAGNGFAFSTNLGVNGTAPVTGMGPGDHTVTLSGLAMNCELSGSNPRTVSMVSGATADVTFDVACTPVTQIAYWTRIGGNAEIYVVNSNGAGITRLTTSSANDVEPSWSPDGSKIAFRSERDGNPEIYVMDATGANPVRLTNNVNDDYDPAWSPDGSKIAFVSNRDGNYDIHVMNADGSNVVRLTNHLARDLEPAWSPDGTKIIFRRDENGKSNIYVMNADGTGVAALTTGGADIQPDWSPDGSKIAFARGGGCDFYYDVCYSNIVVMNADGSNAKQLASDTNDSQPSWSPDGRWIAVSSFQCDYYACSYVALVAIKSDGKSRAEILPLDVGNPSWRR